MARPKEHRYALAESSFVRMVVVLTAIAWLVTLGTFMFHLDDATKALVLLLPAPTTASLLWAHEVLVRDDVRKRDLEWMIWSATHEIDEEEPPPAYPGMHGKFKRPARTASGVHPAFDPSLWSTSSVLSVIEEDMATLRKQVRKPKHTAHDATDVVASCPGCKAAIKEVLSEDGHRKQD